ncbi:MAG: M56 family metallopeptidase [Calditrichia bacterium]
MEYLLSSRDWIFYLLQINLIWSIGFTVLFLLLRNGNPITRYRAFMTFHLLLPIGLVVSLLLNMDGASSAVVSDELTYNLFYETPMLSDIAPIAVDPIQSEPVNQLFSTALLFIAGIIMLLLGKFALQCFQLFRFAGEEESDLKEIMDELSVEIALKKRVRMLLTRFAITPFSFGWRRPLIVIPELIRAKCSGEQIRMILRHELIHIRRNDFIYNTLQKLTRIFFVYNPLIHLSDRLIDDNREIICDQQVLELPGVSRKAYATTLLKVNEILFPGVQLSAAVPFYRKFSQLKGRISMIKDYSSSQISTQYKLTVGIITLICLVGMALTALQAAEDNKEQLFESKNQKVRITSNYVEITKDGKKNRYDKNSQEFAEWQRRFAVLETSKEELMRREAELKADHDAMVQERKLAIQQKRLELELMQEQLKQERSQAQKSTVQSQNDRQQSVELRRKLIEEQRQQLQKMQENTSLKIDKLQQHVMQLSEELRTRKAQLDSKRETIAPKVDEMDTIINALRRQLQKDGLIGKNEKYFNFHMEADRIEVDDKRIADNYYDRYRKLIERIKGKEMTFPYTASVVKS